MSNPKGTRKYPTLFDRLMANTVILPWCGCYIWMGSCNKDGYGEITIRVDGKPKKFYVHRVAKIGIQKLRPGKAYPFRHLCHLPPCWRPDHLVPGTDKQNTQDQIKRGTQTNGWRLMHETRRQEKHIKDILNGK
jgi:hypothetical protein